MDKSQPLSAMDSEKYETKNLPSMIRRRIRNRQSAKHERFWPNVCRRFCFGSDPTMALAIIFCTSVFAVGKCELALRERRQASTIRVSDVTSLQFFDSNGIERGAATMGGRIKMTLSMWSDCTSGSISLLDAAGNRLGEGACGNDNPVIEFEVTDQLALGRFKVKIGEVESESFESRIFYILVKHPIENRCGETSVYAKVEEGSWNQKVSVTKCITPYGCQEQYDRSSKIGCPAGEDGKNSYCYGVGERGRKKPTSETNKAKGCKGINEMYNPYISYYDTVISRIEFISNDGLIKLNKTQPTITVTVPRGSVGKFEYKIDRFDGNPINKTDTIISGQPAKEFEVPLDFFDDPFLAVLQINTTIDNDHEFYTRNDLVYLGTQADMKIIMKIGADGQYEATGALTELCKRVKNMVCGLKTENQYHEGSIVSKAIFYYGFHTWSGELVINEVTPEIETSVVTVATKKITTDGGAGNTVDDTGCPTTTPCAVITAPTPNTTACDRGNNNSKQGRVVDKWIIFFGGILALIMQPYANPEDRIAQ